MIDEIKIAEGSTKYTTIAMNSSSSLPEPSHRQIIHALIQVSLRNDEFIATAAETKNWHLS